MIVQEVSRAYQAHIFIIFPPSLFFPPPPKQNYLQTTLFAPQPRRGSNQERYFEDL